MNNKIDHLVNEKKDKLIEFTQELISIPSPPGKEDDVRKRIKGEMEYVGFDEITIDAMGNLYGSLGRGSEIIAFDSHMDTVDVGNPEKWTHEPFNGTIENEIIYGRGASDQKGGLAAILFALKILTKIGIPENLQIIFVGSVREEEHEGLNWQHLIDVKRIKPDKVVLTEPSNLKIAIGQKGRVDLKITTDGISAHGANPDQGINAIYNLLPIIEDIRKLQKNLHTDPLLGKAQISVTAIESSSPNINATPDKAIIHVDRRLVSNESDLTAIEQLKNLESIKNTHARIFVPEYTVQLNSGKVFTFKSYYPSWVMDQKHPLVQQAMEVYRKQFQEEPQLKYWPFSTNGAATKGIFNIPTIGFGPGKEEHAHTPEDQVTVDHLIKATEFYIRLIRSFKLN